MTIKDYITQKFQSFGMQITEADLWDMCLSMDKSGEDEMDLSSMDQVSVAVARFIPSLLLRASSVSESGFSMSWDKQGIRDYYSLLCKRYGLKDELSSNPQVSFV